MFDLNMKYGKVQKFCNVPLNGLLNCCWALFENHIHCIWMACSRYGPKMMIMLENSDKNVLKENNSAPLKK